MNHWDGILLTHLVKSHLNQNIFPRKKLQKNIYIYAIDKYINVLDNGIFTNNIGFQIIPGLGKTWCCMHVIIYTI